jgi:hypothetical protein
MSTQGGDCNILICDETCDSLSPAVLAALLLVRYQVRTHVLTYFFPNAVACRYEVLF